MSGHVAVRLETNGKSQPLTENVDDIEAYVIPFDLVGMEDIPLVGGKNASLGELTSTGIPVPPGFALSVAF